MAKAKKALEGTDGASDVQGHPEPAESVLLPIEAAELLRVSIDQLYHLTSKKKVPFTKVGGALRFDRAQLLEFIANGPRGGTDRGDRGKAGSRNAAARGSSGKAHSSGRASTRQFIFNTPRRTRADAEK